ncbi:hypothetical protein QBC46DRAFT_272166 [Diplogelasinospora grovesii]|uniref:Uncharacterized protein n=1 Tax=Diplogelasinospora grovesii TaxID=303347 RepID=A0AAN6MZ76_9PEZI|nr:hypothetical protein QBC46DRAFT_272166 [Diplogelasinospora grovesii]
MQLTTLTSLALLALGASAGTVNKRNGEGVHLANCYQNSPLGQIPFSQMLYYADDAQASQNVVPSSSNQCRVTTPGQGGWETWEGSSITCTFPSNTFFTSDIQSGAGGYSVGAYAGSGENNFRNFNCYRDNNHQLYNDGTSSCFSIYYCLDVSWLKINIGMTC